MTVCQHATLSECVAGLTRSTSCLFDEVGESPRIVVADECEDGGPSKKFLPYPRFLLGQNLCFPCIPLVFQLIKTFQSLSSIVSKKKIKAL